MHGQHTSHCGQSLHSQQSPLLILHPVVINSSVNIIINVIIFFIFHFSFSFFFTKHLYNLFSNLYLVLDYLTGGDLRYHISIHQRFNEKETKFFISNIILGLEYIHSKNDLKSALHFPNSSRLHR